MNLEEFKFWARGAIRSWMMWFGIVLVASPTWWPLVEPTMLELFGNKAAGYMAQIAGIITVVLRIKTTMSLPTKGGKAIEAKP